MISDIDNAPDDEFEEEEHEPSEAETKLLRSELQERCKTAGISFEEMEGLEEGDVAAKIALPAGREKRWVHCWEHGDYQDLLAIDFERYTFLSGYDAVCKYAEGTIEALLRPLGGPSSPRSMYAKLFGVPVNEYNDRWSSAKITVSSPNSDPKTTLTLAPVSPAARTLAGRYGQTAVSLTMHRDGIKQHDQAVALLRSLSDALFFQIDMLFDLPLSLSRDRQARRRPRPTRKSDADLTLTYPKFEFDPAPASLYWYARSAVNMPLLQFLAFYQVIEFYYPTYSQAEARRRLRSILKDPTFRGDRDSDLGRVLSAIQFNRSGAVGDERSQLKATLTECVDPEALRSFIIEDTARAEFLSSKAKGLTDHKLPVASPGADLRADVAERIYEIRCKIVHTKTDARYGELELLLPFSKEAEQLHFDIELVQYLAQQVLVSASTAAGAGT